jgi:hypothetical protein
MGKRSSAMIVRGREMMQVGDGGAIHVTPDPDEQEG